MWKETLVYFIFSALLHFIRKYIILLTSSNYYKFHLSYVKMSNTLLILKKNCILFSSKFREKYCLDIFSPHVHLSTQKNQLAREWEPH